MTTHIMETFPSKSKKDANLLNCCSDGVSKFRPLIQASTEEQIYQTHSRTNVHVFVYAKCDSQSIHFYLKNNKIQVTCLLQEWIIELADDRIIHFYEIL